MELLRLSEIHALAGVDQQREVKVFLFDEELDEQLFEARGGVPVYVAQVVAEHVLAVVREFDACAALDGALLALHLPGEGATDDDAEPLELLQKRWVKNGFRHGHGFRSLSMISGVRSDCCFGGACSDLASVL